MKTCLWGIAFLISSVAFSGTPSHKAPADPDYQALAILTKNCAACHNQADHPGALFLNQARLSDAKTLELIKRVVEEKVMPPVHEEFKNSPDGKKLLIWLKAKTAKKEKAK